MIRVGVTGGIGSGKSAVCEIFSELGVPVYSSDLRAHALMCGVGGFAGGDGSVSRGGMMGRGGGGDIRRAIVELLGPGAYRGEMVDTTYVASKVFSDKILLASLNAIVHPAVALDFEAWTLAFAHEPYVVFESAILYESGFDRFVDCVVNVSAPEQVRLERVLARGHGGFSREDVMRRMAGQLSDSERESRAWATIDNSADLDRLAARVAEIDRQLKKIEEPGQNPNTRIVPNNGRQLEQHEDR